MVERSDVRGTARDRIQRILYLLPAAGAEEGVAIEDLCGALGVSRQVLLEDIAEVTAREYYHRAGVGDRLRVSLDGDRVQVRTTGEFRRPPRLTARETLALGLGIRVLAAERDGEERTSLLDLARELEAGLASVSEVEFAPRFVLEEASDPGPADDPGHGAGPPGDADDSSADDPGDASTSALRGRLVEAARERRRCAFRYLKGGGDEPEARRLEPYVVVASTGRWYAIGRDPDRDDIRAFRLDRMLDLSIGEERFEPDPSFDLEGYLTGAYVYRPPARRADGGETDVAGDPPAGDEATAGTTHRAQIRYAPEIARWILEREEADPLDDGSVVVRRAVSDPTWAARHVLQYGGDAELLGPADLRARVAEGARRAERAHGGRSSRAASAN